MNLIGMMPVRNEDWIVGFSARVALIWCDSLVVLDHASTDNTQEILRDLQGEFPDRVDVTRVDGERWDEMNHRGAMLNRARQLKASHVAIIDADEVLTANLVPSIRSTVQATRAGCLMELPGFNLRGANRFHSNGVWGQRWFATAFVDDTRLGWHGDRFHHRQPMGMPLQPVRPIGQREGGILHFWGANELRLREKHALYKITEVLRWPTTPKSAIEATYNMAFNGMFPGEPASWAFTDIPEAWTAPYAGILKHLNVDSEPWQGEECRRLVALHGADRFAGLNLFGVA